MELVTGFAVARVAVFILAVATATFTFFRAASAFGIKPSSVNAVTHELDNLARFARMHACNSADPASCIEQNAE